MNTPEEKIDQNGVSDDPGILDIKNRSDLSSLTLSKFADQSFFADDRLRGLSNTPAAGGLIGEDAPSNKLGSSHVALTVHGLDGIYDDLIEAGFTTKSKVLIAPGNKAKILYAHDPDGAIIELIEDL